ncbi:MAG TPA: glycoside hydrolase family 15 protein [Polyangiaceae bacterium]|nr:glycoside hydrolase family 15 protein [Polyangiaceae bacterium]
METFRLRDTLDAYFKEIEALILEKQHPVTGLLPASIAVTVHGDYRDAWVRDNVYSILAVWGLALAYRALDDDAGRGYELERRTVHLMRSLLRSMMAQSAKVEAFKYSRLPKDALHAKYDTETGGLVVSDEGWGHLQIDATSLYLLMLAQMIRSGLDIIWTRDEVNFVQNLIYYIERAYRTPDYGIWERGDKQNRGSVEINASSVGMAKAALEALSGFDLFGARGSQDSILYVSPDNIAQANITLYSMLPRESNTKETDAALLGIIGFPAFAVHDPALVERVRGEVIAKLRGRYGLKRFLRDGHQTVLEDEARLHYEPEELKQFEHIESEWPLFFAYLYLDCIFRGDAPGTLEYEQRLKSLLVQRSGQWQLPELYYVPEAAIAAEREKPGSQERLPNQNVPLVWAQSLYLLGRMIRDGVLQPGDIDPLGRRRHKPPQLPVVQLIFLAEDEALQAELAAHGVFTETPSDIAPVAVLLPQDIAEVYGKIGENARLGLSGRSARALKTLTTSRFFRLQGQTAVCLASFFMQREFFLAYDLDFVVQRFESELAYLSRNWTQPGRPTVTVLLTHNFLEADRSAFYGLMQQIATGSVGDVPVLHRQMAELMRTACFERIDDLRGLTLPDEPIVVRVTRPTVLSEPGSQRPLDVTAELAIDSTEDAAPLIARLAETDNLYEQVELLGALARLESLDTAIQMSGSAQPLRALIEEVYEQAGRRRVWAVVRRAAGLLGKVDGDLNLAVGAILVRQKNIQVGRAYSDESLIAHPIPDQELLEKINTFCRDDVRDRVLTQELILYSSLLIKGSPELFGELLTIRIGHLTLLLSSELARGRGLTAGEGYEALMALPPSVIQQRLESVLAQYHAIEAPPQQLEQLHTHASPGALHWKQDLGLEKARTGGDGWLTWRQHGGIIDRRPANFYADVWNIFRHTPALIIGDKLERRNRMESSVVLSDTTPGEKSFALWLEHLLNKIGAAEYRQLTIECLRVLASFFRQNPELTIEDTCALDALIGHAVRLSYLAQRPDREQLYSEHKAEAWAAFYASPPERTSSFLVAALRSLLTSNAPSVGMLEARP